MRPKTAEWLAKARGDLRVAEIVLHEGDAALLAYVGFHCQQCIEKALKAFLVESRVEFQKKHELLYALDLCLSVEPAFESLADGLSTLEPYAVDVRYPADLPETPSFDEATEFVRLAGHVVAFVTEALAPKDDAPPE